MGAGGCASLQANVSNKRRVADRESGMKISFITRNIAGYLRRSSRKTSAEKPG